MVEKILDKDLLERTRGNEAGAMAASTTPAPAPLPTPTPTPAPTPATVFGISLTAKSQGYFKLMKNGVLVSRHLQEREAIDAGADMKIADPAALIEYTHDYSVVIDLEKKK